MKKCNIFTVIGIVVSVVAALAGLAYAFYKLVYQKKLCCCEENYEFDCEGCDADCAECPMAADEAEDEPTDAE